MAKANITLSPSEPKNQDAGLTTLCNLSETFVINPEADNPLCALAYSLDALVAHLELIQVHPTLVQ